MRVMIFQVSRFYIRVRRSGTEGTTKAETSLATQVVSVSGLMKAERTAPLLGSERIRKFRG